MRLTMKLMKLHMAFLVALGFASCVSEEIGQRVQEGQAHYFLKARWTFDGDWSDSVGSNDCSLTAGSTATIVNDAQRGWVAAFSGSGIDCGTSSEFDVTGPFTIAFWYRKQGASSVYDEAIINKGTTTWNVGVRDQLAEEPHVILETPGCSCAHASQCGDDKKHFEGRMPHVDDNEWHHIAVVYDSARKHVYVDGRHAFMKERTGTLNTAPLDSVRMAEGGGRSGLNARLDDVRFYSGSLHPDEIRDLAAMKNWEVPLAGELETLIEFEALDPWGFIAQDTGRGEGRDAPCGGTFVTGHRGGSALSLNGSTQYATLFNNATMFADSHTVMVWVKPDLISQHEPLLFGWEGTSTNRLELKSSTEIFVAMGMTDGTTETLSAAVPPIPTGAWTHIAYRWDTNTNLMEVFVNGVKSADVASTTKSARSAGASDVGYIGRYGASYFDGVIDEIRVYNRAVPDDEIWNIGGPDEVYVATSGDASHYGSPSNPVTLEAALEDFGLVHPGTTVWIEGGTYGMFCDDNTHDWCNKCTSTSCEQSIDTMNEMSGTPNARIVYRAKPGQRVTFEADATDDNAYVLRIDGSDTTFWGIEIAAGPDTAPPSSGGTSKAGVYFVEATNGQLVNCVVHDNRNRQGVSDGTGPVGTDIYGTLVYNNGLDGGDCSDPLANNYHGIYQQNPSTTPKTVSATLFFDNRGHGVHAYGGTNVVHDLEYTQVASWQNGLWDGSGFSCPARPNFTFGTYHGGAGVSTRFLQLDQLYSYWADVATPSKNYFGYADDENNEWNSLTNSWFMNGKPSVKLHRWVNSTFTGNRLHSEETRLTGTTLGELHLDATGTATETGSVIDNNEYWGNIGEDHSIYWVDSVGVSELYCHRTSNCSHSGHTSWDHLANEWYPNSGYDESSTWYETDPTSDWVAVIPNAYEKDSNSHGSWKAFIIIYENSGDNKANVSLEGIGLAHNENFFVVPVNDVWKTMRQVSAGGVLEPPDCDTYDSGAPSWTVDLDDTEVGGDTGPHAPDFGAFLVIEVDSCS